MVEEEKPAGRQEAPASLKASCCYCCLVGAFTSCCCRSSSQSRPACRDAPERKKQTPSFSILSLTRNKFPFFFKKERKKRKRLCVLSFSASFRTDRCLSASFSSMPKEDITSHHRVGTGLYNRLLYHLLLSGLPTLIHLSLFLSVCLLLHNRDTGSVHSLLPQLYEMPALKTCYNLLKLHQL